MFCKKCGKELEDGVIFCQFCGQKQTESTGENVSKKEEQISDKKLMPLKMWLQRKPKQQNRRRQKNHKCHIRWWGNLRGYFPKGALTYII